MTQLIDAKRGVTCAADGHSAQIATKDAQGSETYFLDDGTGIQFQSKSGGGAIAVKGGFQTDIDNLGADVPDLSLTKTSATVFVSDKFHMYLMYKPSGSDSIWVTLSRMDWYWSGSATRNLGSTVDQSTTNGDWSLDKNADGTPKTSYVSPAPTGATTSELPQWGNYFTSLHLNCN